MGIYYSEDNVVCGFHYPAEPHKRERSDAIKNSELTWDVDEQIHIPCKSRQETSIRNIHEMRFSPLRRRHLAHEV